jgi:hypothetical protein
VMRTTATPASAVTSLEALSWRCSFFPASSTGVNPRAGLRIGRRRHGCVVSSFGASHWCFVVSLVHVLESLAAAAQSVGVRGAMYMKG